MSYPLRSQPSTPPKRQPRHDRLHRDDTGMTLIEVIVAMGLFLILITSSMSILVVALRTTAVNRDRVGAANLAGRELEILRGQFTGATRGPKTVTTIPVINGNPLIGSAGSPVTLDNVQYTVTRTATWCTVGESDGDCDGAGDVEPTSECDDGTGDELDYLKVRVNVTWDRMSGTGISLATILTPPKGTYSITTGNIGVKIIDAHGEPAASHTVTIMGPWPMTTEKDGTSGPDGCAIFAQLAAGAYTITVDDPGFVDLFSTQTATRTASLQSGQMYRPAIEYDEAATIAVTFVTMTSPPLHMIPTDIDEIPLSFANNGLPDAGSIFRTGTGNPRLVPLWPFLSGYQIWAGNCLEADPQDTGQQRADAVIANPDVPFTSTQVYLAPLKVTGAGNGNTSSRTVYAQHDPDNSCPDGWPGTNKIKLGVAGSGNALLTSLPYGTWKLTNGSGRKATVRLVRGSVGNAVLAP
jgi:prepilin-type N-terminal cleavage/methylation domain-containing protein